MQILHFDADSLGAPYAGGQARRTFEINRRLARTHDVTVVTAGHPTLRPQSVDGVRYARMLPLPFPANLVDYFAEIVPRAWLARADIIVEDFAVPLTASGLPFFVRRPVVGIASFLFAKELARKYRLPFDRWEGFVLRRYRHIVALTQTQAAVIERLAPDADIRVVANGADDEAFRHPWTGAGGYVAYLGRLDATQKGIDLLVEVLRRLPESMRVKIAGDGPARDWLASQVAGHDMGARVELVGRLEGAARHDFVARAAALAFPSRYENQSLVLLDALAIGVPIVAFASDGVRETLEQSAIVVAPFDVDAFAGALQRVVTQREEATRLSDTARERGASFRWDLAAAAQERFYEEVLAATAGPHTAGLRPSPRR